MLKAIKITRIEDTIHHFIIKNSCIPPKNLKVSTFYLLNSPKPSKSQEPKTQLSISSSTTHASTKYQFFILQIAQIHHNHKNQKPNSAFYYQELMHPQNNTKSINLSSSLYLKNHQNHNNQEPNSAFHYPHHMHPQNKKLKNPTNNQSSRIYQSPVLGCLLIEGTSKVGASSIPLYPFLSSSVQLNNLVIGPGC